MREVEAGGAQSEEVQVVLAVKRGHAAPSEY